MDVRASCLAERHQHLLAEPVATRKIVDEEDDAATPRATERRADRRGERCGDGARSRLTVGSGQATRLGDLFETGACERIRGKRRGTTDAASPVGVLSEQARDDGAHDVIRDRRTGRMRARADDEVAAFGAERTGLAQEARLADARFAFDADPHRRVRRFGAELLEALELVGAPHERSRRPERGMERRTARPHRRSRPLARSGLPQLPQNRMPIGFVALHSAHWICDGMRFRSTAASRAR